MGAKGWATAAWLAALAPAAAESPLSAIDWLSNSVAAPQPVAPAPGGPVTENAAPRAIAVTPLGQPSGDAVGLLPPSATGLPRALWGSAAPEAILARLEAVPNDLPPALRSLLATLLLAEANPPVGTGVEDTLLLARVDRLLQMGKLDRAAALLDRAGPEATPERFRRYFDIALLQGFETQACSRMRARPEISPTYPARIFCLARGGDWAAAAVTLETAKALGILSEAEDALLARFLEPELDDGTPLSGDWRAPSPLVFRMLEAVGEPVPTNTLPLAFAWADLRPTRGWKAQLDAAERLARQGALPANRLVGLYLRQKPSASGTVWERAAQVQSLQEALARGRAGAVARTLPGTWAAMQRAGLSHAFSEHYGAELARLGLEGPASDLAYEIGLLSPSYASVARRAAPEGRTAQFLAAVATGTVETRIAPGDMSSAVRAGFMAEEAPAALQRVEQAEGIGVALLRAITLFAEGVEGDPDGVSDAISYLRDAGLDDVARRAALELLIGTGQT
ncbi:MAG: hypothetical protein AAGJ74_09775 [Pseudomonadota bacterium]